MIRKATVEDVKEMQKIINGYADNNKMLSRSLNDLYEHIRDFYVSVNETTGRIEGCCALHVVWETLGEIKALAVEKSSTGKGLGKILVQTCMDDANSLGVNRLFALTYIPGFFKKFGFVEISRDDLPHKVWRECINCPKFPDCDETAVAKNI
ncbi:MAG: N-acetyltransferase [Elusimicrobiota bacterium]